MSSSPILFLDKMLGKLSRKRSGGLPPPPPPPLASPVGSFEAVFTASPRHSNLQLGGFQTPPVRINGRSDPEEELEEAEFDTSLSSSVSQFGTSSPSQSYRPSYSTTAGNASPVIKEGWTNEGKENNISPHLASKSPRTVMGTALGLSSNGNSMMSSSSSLVQAEGPIKESKSPSRSSPIRNHHPSPSPSPATNSHSTSSSAGRFLRRVASAPNAKALFSGNFFASSSSSSSHSSRHKHSYPSSPTLNVIPPLPIGIIPVGELDPTIPAYPYSSSSETTNKSSDGSLKSSVTSNNGKSKRAVSSPGRSRSSPSMAKLAGPYIAPASLSPPSPSVSVGSGATFPPRAAFRRTYSSSSIKVRSVEIGPSSFHKIKLLGKGDVGKVYLVREKTTENLFAMKVLSKREMIKRNKIKRALAEQVRFR